MIAGEGLCNPPQNSGGFRAIATLAKIEERKFRSLVDQDFDPVWRFDPVCHEPPPLFDRMFMHPKPRSHFLSCWLTLSTQKDHPAAVRQRTGCLVPPNLTLKKPPLLRIKRHDVRNPA